MFLSCGGGYTNFAFIRFQKSGEKSIHRLSGWKKILKKKKIEKKERCDDDATITLLWKNTKN
jgi:hypothetical protein